MSKIKLLILGSNGFIGKNMSEYFSKSDKYELFTPKRDELDLLNSKKVEEYFKKNSIDVVVHSAVNILSLEENLQFFYNIERCSKYYKKLITIGSGAEYDMRHYKPMMNEEYFLEHIPADTYGLSKFVASKEIEFSSKNSVNLRVLGIFGKYEDYTRRFISNNISKALCGEDITLYQNMLFDFIYIKDFLKIIEFFIDNEVKYKNYNVCSSKPIALLELANIIKSINANPKTKVVVKEKGLKQEYSANNSRLLNELGNFEFTDFHIAIKELYEWYKNDCDLYEYCKSIKNNG